MAQMTTQTVEGKGADQAHDHEAMVHTHDHYHVSHHHGGVMGEFQHRSYWHSHEHNHVAMRHGHDYSPEDEARNHDKEAHVHDHSSPSSSN